MSDSERLAVGLAVSLAVHWLLLGFVSPPRAVEAGPALAMTDFLLPEAEVSLAAPLTLEAAAGQASPDEEAVDRCRQAVQRYLEDVRQAVHGRRMVVSDESRRLVGNAAFTLRIARDGGFRDIVLAGSSGQPALDRDAEQAVRAASGLIPRPACIGAAPLAVTITVKYQYGL